MTPQERSAVLQELLPGSLQGWNLQKTTYFSTNRDLYAYINGGAELYISYGFGAALSCIYTTESQPEVLADVYDLLEPNNAFGVFSQTRETENLQLGQGAYRMPGAVFFWKDRYYVSLSAQEPTKEAENFILALGDYIDKKIPDTGIIPALVKFLPEEGLVPFGYLYFHHYIWLNSYYFIADDNVLNIDDSTDAVLAKYAGTESRQYLLMVQYASKTLASAAYDSFGSSFFPEGLTENCILRNDNTWLAACLADHMIVAVFNGNSRLSANQLLLKALGECHVVNPE